MADLRSRIEEQLYAIVMEHLSKLEGYVPGQVRQAGGSKEQLLRRYQDDPLFSMFGLDTPEYLGATLSGGTVTSIHRKLGDIYEASLRTIFMGTLNQTAEQITYSTIIRSGDVEEARSADVCILFDRVDRESKDRISAFCLRELALLSANPRIDLVGVGMEIRHCYQTGDSKRTQADEAMARHFLVSGILPVMPLFCNQSNRSIVNRYRSVWVVKQGMESYEMVQELTGFDFHGFLSRNRADFRQPVLKLLGGLAK